MLSILLSLSVNTDEDEGLYNKKCVKKNRMKIECETHFIFWKSTELSRYMHGNVMGEMGVSCEIKFLESR